MWPRYSRGDRYLAYDVDSETQVYNSNSQKGMRDQCVRLLVNARKYTSLVVVDTVRDLEVELNADSVLDWRI